jgi:pimeloyl-ACP methyl ester carboxylesterase
MEQAPKPRATLSRLLRVALVTLVLGYIGLCLLVFVEQRQLLYHPVIRTAAEVNQLAQAANFERWTNATGQFIGLKRLCTNSPAAGSILMLYGNGNTAVNCADYADVIQHTAPFNFYVMEYPGYEDRPGPLDGKHILSAAKEAFQRLDATKPIYLVGESLGTGPASYLAGLFPDQITGIMLLSPYNRLADVAQSHYPFLPARWLLLDDFYSAQYLQTYHGLVGMVIDDRDSVIPASLAHRLYDGLSSPKHLWEYPDCDHVQLGEPPETFWKAVLEFWHTAKSPKIIAGKT